jgi:hypothetical protein
MRFSNALVFKKLFSALMKFEGTQGKAYLTSHLKKIAVFWNSAEKKARPLSSTYTE